MTRVEYNGGPDLFVGKSTEEQPSVEKDGITEGAMVILTDTKALNVFDGENWGELVSFA